MKHYDYIITGAGAAGLSLLMRFMRHPLLRYKRFLVVDKQEKNTNDHTWCFWEKEPDLFEPVVHHQWQQVHFFSSTFTQLLDLQPYRYKMIRSIDFYQFVLSEARQFPNIEFAWGTVSALANEGSKAAVIFNSERITCDYIFNSILFTKPDIPKRNYYLLQHFKGYVINTGQPAFNPAVATLMDFRISQKHGTTFVYVLPLSATKALVEYTLFTKNLLPQQAYDHALKDYIATYLKLPEYQVEEEEFGIIPMTDYSFTRQVDRIINIGTAGGQTKGSSGYTFRFVQKHARLLVDEIAAYGRPLNKEPAMNKRFKLYDSVLLNVLSKNKMPGDEVFARLFAKNPVARVLAFLDNETSFEDELSLMTTMPSGIFMKAAMQELLKRK